MDWKLNLPNKLFESLMAGVPVVVSRGNEQCRLVSAERVGLCAPDDGAALTGRVETIVYFGTDTHYHLRLKGDEPFIGRPRGSAAAR